jgi:hypothetical protein
VPTEHNSGNTLSDTEVDDAFRAVMEGLRTTLPGVQVLFGFLLILPLQAGFAEVGNVELVAYFVAFFGTAITSVLLIAPSAHQRVRMPKSGIRRHSERHLAFTVRMTIVGTLVFAIALTSAVYLVTFLVTTSTGAAIGAAAVAGLAAWAWFYVPLVTFQKR